MRKYGQKVRCAATLLFHNRVRVCYIFFPSHVLLRARFSFFLSLQMVKSLFQKKKWLVQEWKDDQRRRRRRIQHTFVSTHDVQIYARGEACAKVRRGIVVNTNDVVFLLRISNDPPKVRPVLHISLCIVSFPRTYKYVRKWSS